VHLPHTGTHLCRRVNNVTFTTMKQSGCARHVQPGHNVFLVRLHLTINMSLRSPATEGCLLGFLFQPGY
jgi:hypothetical protein